MDEAEIRRREVMKSGIDDSSPPEEEFSMSVPGLTDIELDYEGRTIIAGEVVSDPHATDPWDEENEHAGESPAARQIRLAEENEGDDPAIVVEQPEPLEPAYTDPCPSCAMSTDLRNKHTNITGNMIDRNGIACLAWNCRCGQPRETDGRQLPPDLCEKGDAEEAFLREVASYCEKEPRW